VRAIQKSMSEIAPRFSTTRMQADYVVKYYEPQAAYHQELLAGDGAVLRELLAWKERMLANWEKVSVIRAEGIGMGSQAILTGQEYTGSVVLDLADLSPEDVGVELIFTELRPGEDEVVIHGRLPYVFDHSNGPRAEYLLHFVPPSPGVFDVAIRLYAKNEHLRQRMDFALVRWV